MDPLTQNVEQIVACLRAGGVVALPTETIYGLCCDPRNKQALEKLFSIKQRSDAKQVLCVTGSRTHIDTIAVIPPAAERVLNAFWPGPLTVILPLRETLLLPNQVVSDDGLIALRLSPDPLIAAITQQLDFPIVATSANISGKPFFLNAEQIRSEFGKQLDLIIETDHALLQVPSTIISCDMNGALSVVREGAISLKELAPYIDERT